MIRSLLLIGMLFFCVGSTKAQYNGDPIDFREFYFGTGYNLSFFQKDRLNTVMRRFNDNHPEVTKGFKDVRMPNGFLLLGGGVIGVFNIEAGVTLKQLRRTSKFKVDTGEERRFDIRFNYTDYHLATGLMFHISNNFGFGLGADVNYGRLQLKNREAAAGSTRGASYINLHRESYWGTGVFANLYFGDMNDENTKLMVRPYFNWVFGDADITALDAELNPELPAMSSEDYKFSMSHFGIKFIIVYSAVR